MQFEISDTEKRQNAVGADSGKQEKLKPARKTAGAHSGKQGKITDSCRLLPKNTKIT